MDITSAVPLSAILSAAASSLYSTNPASVAVPTADQLNATAQLLGRVNSLALASFTVRVRSQAWDAPLADSTERNMLLACSLDIPLFCCLYA